MTDPTQRFAGRVDDYARYRPGYPPEVVELLRRDCGLTGNCVVADVGSGTGILARLLLDSVNRVIMVEPNDGMRHAAERLLSGCAGLESVAGTAEATNLPENSVDLISVGQAFHWFDPAAARVEFGRVLKKGGNVVLVWNARRKSGGPFLEAYERLLDAYATDYAEVDHEKRASPEQIHTFFAPNPIQAATFKNRQVLDLDGLRGRMLSSSYVPTKGQPGHREMLTELENVFGEHEKDSLVTITYDTRVYYGPLAR